MEKQSHTVQAFHDFTEKAAKIPSGRQSYGDYTTTRTPVAREFTKQQIIDILKSGDPIYIRELSRYYTRFSGLYNRFLLYISTIIGYDTIVIPKYDVSNPPAKATLVKQFTKACQYVDSLETKKLFPNITYEVCRNGIYYGLLREQNGKRTIQTLPVDCCRTRFKDIDGLDILEFNLNFFNKIYNEKVREDTARGYPDIIYKAYKKYFTSKNRQMNYWVEITPQQGGVVFYFNNETCPPFAAAIPEILELESARDREAERDEKELLKIFIQKLPIDSKTGELVFDLPEATEIHRGTVEMLKDQDTIQVVTTFADTELASVQDTNAASQSNDKINKYKTMAYDSLGSSEMVFNASGNSAIAHSIHKDIALVSSWSESYRLWLRTLINTYFAKNKLTFDIEILSINESFKKETVSMYLNAAQYGYSKFYAGVALGVKQSNLMSLTDFENNILDLPKNMIPLKSSYTSSSVENKTEKEKVGEGDIPSDNLNEDIGRPEQEETSLSDKTISNIDGAT